MANITDLLQSLITEDAEYNSITKAYVNKEPVNNQKRIMISNRLASLINNYLIQDIDSAIPQRYFELMHHFQIRSDRELAPEVVWLEHILSKGINNGECIALLNLCYQKQINPAQFVQIEFENINTRDDLHKWLTQLKENDTTTPSGRILYQNLLNLLEQSEEYFDKVGRLKPKGIAVLVSSLPGLILGLGVVVAAQELFAIYALFFVLLKGGKLVEKSSRNELKAVGNVLQNVSIVSAATVTTVLVYLMRLVFWGVHQGYMGGSGIQAAFFWAFKNTSAPFTQEMLETELRDAIANNRDTGSGICNFQLRIITSPIEARIGQIHGQTLVNARTGWKKLEEMTRFLNLVKSWDKSELTMTEKLEKVQETLKNVLQDNKEVNSGKTALAIQRTADFLNYFIENPDALMNSDTPESEECNALTNLRV